MKTAVVLLVAVAAALGGVVPAHAYETYKVIDLKPGDTLVIREEPNEGGKVSDWKELGRIPAGSSDVLGTGRTKMIGNQRWHEVSYNQVLGWVNSRFIDSIDPVDLKDATFSCAGTEPFWGVTVGPKEGEYSDPDSKTALTTVRVQPSTARLFPLLYRLTGANGRTYRVSVSRQSWCTDGMSDYDYAFQVLLSDDDVFQEGCCVLKR